MCCVTDVKPVKVAGSRSGFSVCAVRRSGDREFRRLLGGSGVQIAHDCPSYTHTHTHIHRVSSLYHKSLTTEPSSNRRRHIQSTFHLCCCCRAGHIYSSVRQYRKRRRGEVSGWLHNADTLLPPAAAGTGLPTRHACCAAICSRDGRRRAKISAAVITEGDNFMGPALSY